MPKNELKELQNMKLKVSMPELRSAMDSSQTMMALIREQNAIFRHIVRILQSLNQAARKRDATLQQVSSSLKMCMGLGIGSFLHRVI